jgi:hypothetical protein
MIKIAKELNKVIDSLEQMGLYREASSIHNVFVKVAQDYTEYGDFTDTRTVAEQQANLSPQAQQAQQAYKGNPQVYQNLITMYRNRLYQEATTSNDATLPQTSDFYRQVMVGTQLTEQEKQAFRAQAYRIRQEAQYTNYGKQQPQQGQFNLPLVVENLVKQSGIMQITDPQQLQNSKTQIFNTISQQIKTNVPQQQQQQYLQYANNILGTYINSRSATLGVQAQQQAQQPQQAAAPQAQQSPTVSPM